MCLAMRIILLLSAPLLLGGCLARTAVDIVTLPVRAAGAGRRRGHHQPGRGRPAPRPRDCARPRSARAARPAAASARSAGPASARPSSTGRRTAALRLGTQGVSHAAPPSHRQTNVKTDGARALPMAGLRRQSDPDLGEAEKRPSLARQFTQDFQRVDDEQEESAARERMRSLDHVPAFLLGVHIVCAAALLVAARRPGQSGPVARARRACSAP